MYPQYLAERDCYDDLLGKGAGDPDVLPIYPGEKQWIGVDKPQVQRIYDPINRRQTNTDYDCRFDEDLEDNDTVC